MGNFLDSYSFSSAAKDSLRTIYASHDSFRERVSPFDVDGSEPDATIFSNYSASERRAALMIEQYVYTHLFDQALLKLSGDGSNK